MQPGQKAISGVVAGLPVPAPAAAGTGFTQRG